MHKVIADEIDIEIKHILVQTMAIIPWASLWEHWLRKQALSLKQA